jgi:Carboxypeptidase regulatory-like domain
MRLACVMTALLGVQVCLGVADAQIITISSDGDKAIICAHSGLSSDLKDCGTRADWYNYVFVGSISAITPAEDGEEQLLINPEEIFSGNPAASLTVMTSQARCLAKMAVGDRWLFFLRQENGKPIVLDYYGNDSLPIDDARDEIETLRLLESIGDRGIVRGQVSRGWWGNWEPLVNAVVVAQGGPADLQFAATTDADGKYKFPPLPAGGYKISVEPVGSFQPDDSTADVTRGSCWDLTLTRSPHAEISGQVRYTNGSPVAGAEVLFMHADESMWSTFSVDATGHFLFDSLEAGTYVIGIHLPGDPNWQSGSAGGVPPPPASLYFPGVLNRAAAGPITLQSDERRDDINFTISTK